MRFQKPDGTFVDVLICGSIESTIAHARELMLREHLRPADRYTRSLLTRERDTTNGAER